MNERIQSLSEIAKTKVPSGLIVERWIQKYNEEFAKLIINECISVIHEQERIPKEFFYPKSAHMHELAIKQHFGEEQ